MFPTAKKTNMHIPWHDHRLQFPFDLQGEELEHTDGERLKTTHLVRDAKNIYATRKKWMNAFKDGRFLWRGYQNADAFLWMHTMCVYCEDMPSLV